jgi:hypothetical protein
MLQKLTPLGLADLQGWGDGSIAIRAEHKPRAFG